MGCSGILNIMYSSYVLCTVYQIEAIMNDFIQLKPLSNVYEAETMVEG